MSKFNLLIEELIGGVPGQEVYTPHAPRLTGLAYPHALNKNVQVALPGLGDTPATCGYYFNTLPECSPITFGNFASCPLCAAVGAGDFPVFGWCDGFSLAIPYPGCEGWYAFAVFAWRVFIAA